jgi:hypothetical protein
VAPPFASVERITKRIHLKIVWSIELEMVYRTQPGKFQDSARFMPFNFNANDEISESLKNVR